MVVATNNYCGVPNLVKAFLSVRTDAPMSAIKNTSVCLTLYPSYTFCNGTFILTFDLVHGNEKRLKTLKNLQIHQP